MKIAQYVETFSYVGMFITMNFASYICLYLISPFMQHPVCIYLVCMIHNTELRNKTLHCDKIVTVNIKAIGHLDHDLTTVHLRWTNIYKFFFFLC